MTSINLLYKSEIPINDYLSIRLPTVAEVLETEDDYYGLISMLTAMPIDLIAQLSEIGIDFTKIDEYELFLLLFKNIRANKPELLIKGIDLNVFETVMNEKTNEIILYDRGTGAVIDRAIHSKIAQTVRSLYHIKKDVRKPGNDAAKDFMIERAKVKHRRRSKRKQESELEKLIISLVNTAEFKYNYETVLDLSIYQFNESFRQIKHKIDYDNRMYGIYAGTIKTKTLSQDQLTWLKNK